MDALHGHPGQLAGRLLDVVDEPGPQLRAVATTLLIKAVEVPDELALMEAMVASDDAGAMIDPAAAADAGLRLRARLSERLVELAGDHGEAAVVVAMRDHVVAQVQRWAARAVDDADNRRRAEKFLAWAERPEQLEAAQRRGLFAGMDAAELRRMAETRVGAPVSAETALGVWVEVDRWLAAVEAQVGDAVVAAWRAAGGG